jgi:hypothetical protein
MVLERQDIQATAIKITMGSIANARVRIAVSTVVNVQTTMELLTMSIGTMQTVTTMPMMVLITAAVSLYF